RRRGAMAGFREHQYGAGDGLRLYYRAYGDPDSPALPVLCLSGLTRNSRDFHHLAGRLAAGRRVICPDYRGRGCSARDPDWRSYPPRVYVDDILHLVVAANLHRFIVFGGWMGGLLAMGLAAARPTGLAGVVLNDVGPEINVA